jgi:hypothetical protein
MPKLKPKHVVGLLVILLVAILGLKSLLFSHAQTPYAETEVANGAISGPATVQSDSSATYGKYLQFGPSIPGPISSCNQNPVSGSEPDSFLSQPPTLGAVTSPAVNPCLRSVFIRPKNVIAVDNNLWVDDDNGLT